MSTMLLDTERVWRYADLILALRDLCPVPLDKPIITGSVGHGDRDAKDLDIMINIAGNIRQPQDITQADNYAFLQVEQLTPLVNNLFSAGFVDLYLDKATSIEWVAFAYTAGVHDARAYRHKDIKIQTNTLPLNYYRQKGDTETLTGLDVIVGFDRESIMKRGRVQYTINTLLSVTRPWSDSYMIQDRVERKNWRRFLWKELLPLCSHNRDYYYHHMLDKIWKKLEDLGRTNMELNGLESDV